MHQLVSLKIRWFTKAFAALLALVDFGFSLTTVRLLFH